MKTYDTQGARQQPPEQIVVLTDQYKTEIYQNETYYENQHITLAEENLSRYAKEYVEELTAGEANELLRELLLRSEYEEIIKDALKDTISNQGIIKVFDLIPKGAA